MSHTPSDGSLDLDGYLRRIGYEGGLEPSVETLSGLHFAHATTIPFENLDVILGRTVQLDLESLQVKLVQNRRGGYCYEHNLLFAAVLELLGFSVTRLGGRVRMGQPRMQPRTHMLLRVDVAHVPWLTDVGFGGEGLLGPLRLDTDEPHEQFGSTYRVIHEGAWLVLQSWHGSDWFDLYSFTLEEQYLQDYVVANHYIATHPDSPFSRGISVQRPGPHSRLALRGRTLVETTRDGTRTFEFEDDDALLAVLVERFDLHLPPGTRLLS